VQGADLNNQNVNGATCLIYAASAGKIEVVKALVAAGADLSIQTLDGFNALDSAATLPILRYLKPCYAPH
jgi:ankyrin repeat protein